MEIVEKGESQRMKFQENVEDGEEDRISLLPDCLLLAILSRLPSTKFAIRTGTLSKRWNHLWTLVPTLIFQHCSDEYKRPFFIDETLTQCRQLKLKRFQVHIRYDSRLESHVNNWIRYAIKRNVEELNLTLWIMEPEGECLVDEVFFISSSFTDLRFSGCKLKPSAAISWTSLRSLYIRCVDLDEALIENILCGSPLLDTLVLDDCYGFSRLDITSKSVKELVFSGYNDPYSPFVCNIIEINAPNILSLIIEGDLVLWKVLLVNMYSLVKANLKYRKFGQYVTTQDEVEEEMLRGLILNLRHVKDLKIGGECLEAVTRLKARGFDFPSNIKFPESECESGSEIESKSDTNSVEGGD